MMEEDSIEMKKEEVMMKKSTFTMNDSISKEILVDEKGMTLYVFKKDVKNTSNCA
jgi:predicted lipoprotein with Yx(FWY)xxD motif